MVKEEWFSPERLRPGAELFGWDRPFSLWGYSGSHSRLLLRSCGYDPDMDPDFDPDIDPDFDPDFDRDEPPVGDKWPRTRIDLLFKPVYALELRRLSFSSLRVRVATEPVTEPILGRLPRLYGDERVLELVCPEGLGGFVVCMATGYREDDGEDWEPSPFAEDLSDGRTPPWRLRVLGGGPDGELTARYASVEQLKAAARADLPSPSTGAKGRWLYVLMMRTRYDSERDRPHPVGAFVTRHEAEARREQLSSADAGDEVWISPVPIDL